jgi:glycosidase
VDSPDATNDLGTTNAGTNDVDDADAIDTVAEPWIVGDGDWEAGWNAQDEAADPASVLSFYRTMTALRRTNRALLYGSAQFIGVKRKHYFGYFRELDGERLFIECNLWDKPVRREPVPGQFTLLVSNYATTTLDGVLRPYEANVYRAG